ncbi:hypothetical protein [Streptomyces chattanoogensis]|uniref:Lipoprotein n=1 Tax=Streptomyces chattanoogensis TaxID=66876 RepID=A0A0N0GUN9_9ACTN|nr:hypothetical protein [Streptomyces chattanoogensis]KPC58482.1 hypothetical protein ADL29_39300 [Streptomyces chattanoogensis]
MRQLVAASAAFVPPLLAGCLLAGCAAPERRPAPDMGDMSNEDSSWANHGISGPDVPDHVKVYDGRELQGDVTLCLAPGQEVGYDSGANDRGSSHTWSVSC